MDQEVKRQLIRKITDTRVGKLRLRMRQLIRLLNFFGKDRRVKQLIDVTYYTQKQDELEALEQQLNESLARALRCMKELDNVCGEASSRWNEDFEKLKQLIGRTVEVK